MGKTAAEKIDEVVDGPASVSTDVGSVSEHPIRDLIELDRHQAAKKSARGTKFFGCRTKTVVLPGPND